MSKQPYRHGDVLLIPVDEDPKGQLVKLQREGGNVVLALGEHTGHSHVIGDDGAVLNAIITGNKEPSGDRLLQLERESILRQVSTNPREVEGRDLHGPITLPAGNYIVRIQRQLEHGHTSAVID